MQRIKLFFIFLSLAMVIAVCNITYGQAKQLSADDKLLQDSIYKVNKEKVMDFSMKDFEELFLNYFLKRNDTKNVLTKTDFYTYTVQISMYYDRLGILYPGQKQVVEENKERWLAKSYEDYLQYKQSQKK
ncbi:hypothetical protein SGQ44_03870 [Flavobacterium sp. Fl-77]|uniref:DUF4296 domain-containing protein n=1 Tax=Flavobacterium flavipigmentatum TaxID=2893884 RepID=A0AAJ2VX59_9FLAO|nr:MULTISPECIES: hypothetical protein [unclassified Flavobacterium]MDX6181274.1 hypothetical protein [Flavobacterium sp. Fl-33]MDX6184875.1 hypothetical protein [Flavobacterium sp. Fl-77]UFH39967.1 hypothetical protein LNP22_06760 [Flavobacterium sp. F-70]